MEVIVTNFRAIRTPRVSDLQHCGEVEREHCQSIHQHVRVMYAKDVAF